MGEPLSLTVIGRLKDRIHAFVANYQKRSMGYHYSDARIEISEGQSGYAQNGAAKERDADAAIAWVSASMPGAV